MLFRSDRVTAQTCGGCTVELFVADGAAGTYGEGTLFIGSAVADAGGLATITPAAAAGPRVITAVAIDGMGNTSEFSRNVTLPG